MRHLLLAAVLLIILTPGTIQAAPDGQACTPITTGENGVTLTGVAAMNTPPFDLSAGSYVVHWSSSKGAHPIGNVIVYVKRADGGYFAGSGALVNRVIDQTQTSLSGETHLYGVKAGAHYLDVMSPGEWTVTLTPLS